MKRRPKSPGSASIACLPCPQHEAAGGLHDDELGCTTSGSHLTVTLLVARILISLQRLVTDRARRCGRRRSVPGQCATGLVFDDAGFKKVAFLLQVDHFAHPGERVFLVREERLEAEMLC